MMNVSSMVMPAVYLWFKMKCNAMVCTVAAYIAMSTAIAAHAVRMVSLVSFPIKARPLFADEPLRRMWFT